MYDFVQISLQAFNVVISAVGVYYWKRIGKNNLALGTAVWWPIALLINNLLYSATSILFLFGIIVLPYPVILTYWSQAVRLQLGVTLLYGVWIMDVRLSKRGGKS